jgi:DNA-binding transcriptional LysR family regulator
MNITVRQLRAFIAVASSGNFTRASERLHIAQSAISSLIRELEAQLGIRLLDRTTRRVELTDAGREFQANAVKIMADLEHAVHNAHELVARRRGRIVVAAPPLLAATVVPSAIADFNRDLPGIRVAVVDTQTKQIAARVKSGDIDIGIGTFSAADDDGLTRTPLARDTLALFCAARDPLAARRRVRWRDLKGARLIALSHDSGVRAVIEYGYQSAGMAADPAFEVSQMATALGMAEAGLGVTILPRYTAAYGNYRKLVVRPLCEPVVPQDIVAVSRKERSLPPAADDFLRRLRGRMAALSSAAVQ